MSEFAHPPQTPRRNRARARWDQELQTPLALEGRGAGTPEAWFLGPRAENDELLRDLIREAIDSHAEFRRRFHPEDPSHLDSAIRGSPEFRDGVERLKREARALFEKLQLSAPFASMRYQGHMLWDQALPATIGQFAAGLYNQNNVAAEASPVTTRLEIEAGNDLCRMLGYAVPEPGQEPTGPMPWGHITSGGTVANIEAMWAARNLKFFGVAARAAIREVPLLAPARDLEVPLWSGEMARLIDLDPWTLLNLDLDVLAGLVPAFAERGISIDAATNALRGYTLSNVGLVGFYRNFLPNMPEPVFLVPATGHYSWPKAATVLGLGRNAVIVQRVDIDARLDLEHVEVTLGELLRRRVPLIAVVAVIGSTEESAVDPIADLLALRARFRARGLNFSLHADAAWGGYFRTMLREEGQPGGRPSVPTFPMSDYTRAQYEALPGADSITVDPHKGGYVPYPAGALCYRNAAFRDAISLRAPVVFHSQTEPTVGVYGLEGSKPGAAAASVWLAHRVIRPDSSGYGRILGQCMWTSKRLFCRLATLEDPRFGVTLFNRTPAERRRAPTRTLNNERSLMRRFAELDNAGLQALLHSDARARELFSQIGSDQVILAFALNAKLPDGSSNPDLAHANALNERVFALCSVIEPRKDFNEVELILTSSRFDPAIYGQGFVERFCRRMGVVAPPGEAVDFLISTTMDPWTTEANGFDFLETIEGALRRAAHRALDEMESEARGRSASE
jgi:glutamate/tyrosine decarboxylase-like PLP-dependent enzyme